MFAAKSERARRLSHFGPHVFAAATDVPPAAGGCHIFCGRESSSGFNNAADGLVSMCRGNAKPLAKYGPHGVVVPFGWEEGEIRLAENQPCGLLYDRSDARDPIAQHGFIMLDQTRSPAIRPSRPVSHDSCRNSRNPKSLGEDHRGESVC